MGSILPKANSTWHLFNIEHELACYWSGGPWVSNIECITPGVIGS
jgi:hypothetical protein